MRHTVYLFRLPNCVRGWLAYLTLGCETDLYCTVKVRVEAESGAKAKNKAITMINRALRDEPTEGFAILNINRRDPDKYEGFWSADKHIELQRLEAHPSAKDCDYEQ